MPTTQLSEHFTLEELIHSDTAAVRGIDNRPRDPAIVEQLRLLATNTLEKIRTLCGDHPVTITSGYRCPTLNACVGGVSDSAHLYGCAADFVIPDFGTPSEICRFLLPYMTMLELDQLIDEAGGGGKWVHVGRALPPAEPRHMALNITDGAATALEGDVA